MGKYNDSRNTQGNADAYRRIAAKAITTIATITSTYHNKSTTFISVTTIPLLLASLFINLTSDILLFLISEATHSQAHLMITNNSYITTTSTNDNKQLQTAVTWCQQQQQQLQ
ncbi:unnamed protein product [Polarella glacialis]|uniref:Uncharacterized protein n=1 Tax=Polarella glacialis TaxID=89957 RepID=A0A813M4V7_POLGL|nr:unnamed protein product [Polarella glacialis]